MNKEQEELERIETDLMAGYAEGHEWVAGIDASALKRHREAVEAAIRAPLEARIEALETALRSLADCDAWDGIYIRTIEPVFVSDFAAAALAGVPKEAPNGE